MSELITLAHGSGGIAMQELIEKEILAVLNPNFSQSASQSSSQSKSTKPLEDSAHLLLNDWTQLEWGSKIGADRLAMSTDSFVIDPIFFSGGDIGSLAVNGTVNDLAVSGAKPLYLSCGLILEEGLALSDLRRILQSMKRAADSAGVRIVTGDTKVVNRGCADKIFINTCGIGAVPHDIQLSPHNIRPGDLVLVNGGLGEHGASIMAGRSGLQTDLQSDCRSLHAQTEALLRACPQLRCMRDATRGGLAAVLNELARATGASIQLQESALPVATEVEGLCELLGLDALYLANEGKFAAIVPEAEAEAALAALRAFPEAKTAAIVGQVQDAETYRAAVSIKNNFGTERIVDTLYGEQLPRIC